MADRFKFAEVRQQVIEMLKTDLLGPSCENEILSQNPRFEYIVGMLAPQTSEDDGSNEQEIDGDVSFDGDADYTAGEEDDNEPVSVYIDRSWIRGYETDLIGETRPARDSIILLLFGPSDPNSIDAEEKEHQIRGMRHLLKDYEIEIKYRAIFQDEDDLSSLIITFDTYKDKFIQ